MSDEGLRILAVGDVHCAVGYDNKRLRVAGEYAASYRPDVIVFIGDVGDMPSLNLHRKRIEMEGSRYKLDCEVTRDGLSEFMAPLYASKKKLPRRVVAGGNHEHYVRRLVEENPKLEGIINLERDLGFRKFGFEYHEYQDRVNIGGFFFCHNIATKSSFSADCTSPKWGFVKKGVSMVCGHTHTAIHLRHTMLDEGGGRRKIHGINLGCFIHPDMGRQEHWSSATEYTYDRGIWTFENAKRGDAMITMIRAAEDLGV